MSRARSEALFTRAQNVLPGGVNSPVRAYRAVGGNPPFLVRGQGCRVWDEDGNEYIDFVGSWGPLILGHSNPEVLEAVGKAMQNGLSFGAPTAIEVEIAELLVSMVPGIDMVRMVNSGTEAVMSALRVARGVTGREKLIKFEGCYHGHSNPEVLEAVGKAMQNGLSFGAPTAIEVEIAELLVSMVPGIDMVRMVNSGTEAVMSALRVARGVTGREKLVKFEGCYHGHSDAMLVGAGSGALTQGVPDSAGVTRGAARDTLLAQYNDLDSVSALFDANPGEIAAVIVEPVAALSLIHI